MLYFCSQNKCKMNSVLTEITPLSDKDCFFIIERHKTMFSYPLHQHKEFELNFIENGAGLTRIVGDSVEETGDLELVLIGSENLEHVWEGGVDTNDIREVTIQFSSSLLGEELLSKNQFAPIKTMLANAKHGLSFSRTTILKVYTLLDELISEKEKFYQFLKFLQILYVLSTSDDARVLSSSSFAKVEKGGESRRVLKVKEYISAHYSEIIKLSDVASLVGMSQSAFSRFFKLRTGRTFSEYIIEIRLGVAARMLVDSNKNVSEICYECGFNNLSNFNRIFKSRRGYSPREFRSLFKKTKTLV